MRRTVESEPLQTTRGPSGEPASWAVADPLDEVFEERAPRVTGAELRPELAMAAAFLTAAVAVAVWIPATREWDWPLAVALITSYAVVSRISFHVGAVVAVPTQLVMVPMLFALPVPMVPLAVGAGLILGGLPNVITGRAPPERLVLSLTDSIHALGPALVLGLAAAGELNPSDWPLYAAAFIAQSALDLLVTLVRAPVGRSVELQIRARVHAWIYIVDTLLTPVGILAALAAQLHAYAPVLVVSLGLLLLLLARERTARILQARDRLAALRRERTRVDTAVRRIGESFASNLDGEALLDITLRASVDALDASGGRALMRPEAGRPLVESARVGELAECEHALAAVEATVTKAGTAADLTSGACAAMGYPLRQIGERGEVMRVLAVVRVGEPFAASERELFHYLAAQASVSIENAALHEQLHRQALTDGLTGLSNHRRFQELLQSQVEHARRLGSPLGLIILDVDDFKNVNDSYGHQTGDLVLEQIAQVLRDTCRASDEPARYGGEEFALAMPGMRIDEAEMLAERLRTSIESLEIPLASGGLARVTASFGVAAIPDDAADIPDGARLKVSLLAAADTALYVAKRSGKNRTSRALPPNSEPLRRAAS